MKKVDALMQQVLSQGVYIVGVTNGQEVNAFTAAWVMQVSFSPVMLAISINPEHHSYQLLKEGGVCSVNVLSQAQMSLAAHFGKAYDAEKMKVGSWETTAAGVPILKESLAYFDCKLSHEVKAGDHQLVICEVLEAQQLNEGVPMLYGNTGDMDASAELY